MPRKSELTESNKEAIKILIAKGKSDPRIARILGLSYHAIVYYRKRRLNIYKTAGRPELIVKNTFSIDGVNKEIEALQNFANYPSLMNGAKFRMESLIKMRDGIYV